MSRSRESLPLFYFNPRPRKEGDLATIDNFVQVIISIHALAKRATKTAGLSANEYMISIHALAKRATSQKASTRTFTSNFNPRPRKEGDLQRSVKT